MSDIDAILDRVDANQAPSVDGLLHLLRFASVSSQEEGRKGIEDCAEWLKSELEGIGFETRIVPTAGHPLVLGKLSSGSGRPRVLLYGHYDVQPGEPLDAWTTPPFEPEIRHEDGLDRVYSRGASDSKGQVWSVIEALVRGRVSRRIHSTSPYCWKARRKPDR